MKKNIETTRARDSKGRFTAKTPAQPKKIVPKIKPKKAKDGSYYVIIGPGAFGVYGTKAQMEKFIANNCEVCDIYE